MYLIVYGFIGLFLVSSLKKLDYFRVYQDNGHNTYILGACAGLSIACLVVGLMITFGN